MPYSWPTRSRNVPAIVSPFKTPPGWAFQIFPFWFQPQQLALIPQLYAFSSLAKCPSAFPVPRISPTSNDILTEILMILSKRCTWGPMKSNTKYCKTQSTFWPSALGLRLTTLFPEDCFTQPTDVQSWGGSIHLMTTLY